jgi:tripartite-type tricarboxylate transporter receptor subunit TctC
MKTMVVAAIAAAAASIVLPQAAASAQSYPTKPIRVVVPFAPGGGLDILARLLGQKFHESTAQTAIIDNRTGAGGNIGADIVAKAPPDGYTVLLTSTSLAVNASLYRKLPYDAVKDFAPVSLVASVPLVLVVSPSGPKALPEWLGAIKAKPDALNYASNGAGTTSHLSGELVNILTGARMTHVPYKGGVPATLAVAGGEANMLFTTIPSAMPQIKAGKVKALAVSTAKPSSALPGVPVMASVLPGFETDNWYGMFVPASTPRAVVARLNRETVNALKSQELRDFLARDGAEPIGGSPEQLSRYFSGEIVKYAKLVKAAKATAD